jgi:integrase
VAFRPPYSPARLPPNGRNGIWHFHNLRGTAATKFYVAGISVRVIAEVMAWEEQTVEKITRRYVGRQAATKP